MAYALRKPLVAVHHLEGHLLSPLLSADPPAFPYLALLVSGGHTMIVDVRGVGQYEVLGESLDDAAGEAFEVDNVSIHTVTDGSTFIPTGVGFVPPIVYPNPMPGRDQAAVWTQIRRYNPDWVITWNLSAMHVAAAREMKRNGVSHFAPSVTWRNPDVLEDWADLFEGV